MTAALFNTYMQGKNTLGVPQLPMLEATCKVASTFPYKHSNPSLTTHLSGGSGWPDEGERE